LVWDDSVAPETTLDMEAPHVSNAMMFYSMGFMAACMGALVGFIAWLDPETNCPVSRRTVANDVVPYGGMLLERGLMPVEDEA
jgi:hypothetical protein